MPNRINVENNPINWIDQKGLTRTTVDVALEQAIRRGNIAEVQAIAEAIGLSIPPAILAQIAANSIDGGVEDIEDVRDLIDKIKDENKKKLDESVCETRTPTQFPGPDPDPGPPKGFWKKVLWGLQKALELWENLGG